MSNMPETRVPPGAAVALWVIFVLFCARVLGQIVVAVWAPGWFPPMEKWYSGLMPYRYLLPSQFVVIGVLAWIAMGVSRNRGIVVAPRPGVTRSISVFAAVYLLVMVVRYVVRMATMPDERWTGGCIPIFMHWGLAVFLFVYAWSRRRIERLEDA